MERSRRSEGSLDRIQVENDPWNRRQKQIRQNVEPSDHTIGREFGVLERRRAQGFYYARQFLM